MKFLFAVLIIFAFAGCGFETPHVPNPQTVSFDWHPDKVRLSCASASCLDSVGMLFSVAHIVTNYGLFQIHKLSVHRCTASLYDSTNVITAAHCVNRDPNERLYFRTVATPHRPSQTLPVRRVVKSKMDRSQPYATDYASLELESPANDFEFVQPPATIHEDLREITALVADPVGSNDQWFEMVHKECEVDTDDSALSSHPSIYPSVFATKTCSLYSGNSGSPLFTKNNSREMIGITSKSSEAGTPEERAERDRVRLKFGIKIVRRGVIAHTGCIDIPHWPRPHLFCHDIIKPLTSSAVVVGDPAQDGKPAVDLLDGH